MYSVILQIPVGDSVPIMSDSGLGHEQTGLIQDQHPRSRPDTQDQDQYICLTL